MRSETAKALACVTAVVAGLAGSCNTRGSVSIPSFGDDSMIAAAPLPPPPALKWLSGVYGGGSVRFGADPVLHATSATLSVFTSTKVTYAITTPGCIEAGSRLVFEGYWRQSTNTETGLVRLELLPRDLARAICSGQTPPLEGVREPRFEGPTGSGS